MARNKVQFQRGLSDGGSSGCGTEEKCREALFLLALAGRLRVSGVQGLRRQTSLTAGTIFATTKLDLACGSTPCST
jgi:hypothetical protein